MKKVYIAPEVENLHMMAESMLAASITKVAGVEGLTLGGEDDGTHEADVKGIFGDNLFE